MSETLTLVLALVTGVLLSAISSAACGGRFRKWFCPNGQRFGSLAACCCERALLWLVSILSRVVIGSGCWCACLDLSFTPDRDPSTALRTSTTNPSDGKANIPGTGGQTCTLLLMS